MTVRYGGLRVSGVVAPSAAGLGPALSHIAGRFTWEANTIPVATGYPRAERHSSSGVWPRIVVRYVTATPDSRYQ